MLAKKDRAILFVLLPVLALVGLSAPPALAQPTPITTTPAQAYEARAVRVPGTTVEFELIRCPAVAPAGSNEGTDADIPALWVLGTETPWELYDIFVYALDQPQGGTGADDEADAVTRPSKPYVPPDRGFGHEGYPAMGMTLAAAQGFCRWLSDATGIEFRLPTDAEWTHLASAGSGGAYPEGLSAQTVGDSAWTAANAEFTTHPVGVKPPNPFGLHDTLGNVAEWVTSDSRRPVAMGGSFRDPASACTATASQQQERSWNASDPQIPKSRFWLADCSWVGFRFVTEQDPEQNPDQGDDHGG